MLYSDGFGVGLGSGLIGYCNGIGLVCDCGDFFIEGKIVVSIGNGKCLSGKPGRTYGKCDSERHDIVCLYGSIDAEISVNEM